MYLVIVTVYLMSYSIFNVIILKDIITIYIITEKCMYLIITVKYRITVFTVCLCICQSIFVC